jgi:hypothetical protein
MSTQVSQEVVPKTPQARDNEIIRRTANYHASIWGDQFISHLPKDKVCVCVCDSLLFSSPFEKSNDAFNMVTKAGA